MRCLTKLVMFGLVIAVLSGCAGKKIRLDPNDPLFGYKNEFYSQHRFYFLENELETLASLSSVEALDKFKADFLKIRDTDPRTPENEWKIKVDSRIADIKNEILFSDNDTSGTSFEGNGGLGGDMAHVYLLHGMPHFKAKLIGGTYHVDLMVWYYFGPRNKPLMRFLFYENGGKMELFREYTQIMSEEQFYGPTFSPLRRLSNRPVSTGEELYRLWNEILSKDIAVFYGGYYERVFSTSVLEFSSYTDVFIEGGDGKKRFGALDVPEPAAFMAKRFRPTILGQPDIQEGTELSPGDYHSFIPAHMRSKVDSKEPTFLMITVFNRNIDWKRQDNNNEKPYAANFNLRISFQNKKTKKLTEFFTGFKRELSQAEFDQKDNNGEVFGVMVVFPVFLKHWEDGKPTLTLGDMIKQLEPGEYIANIYLQHTLTKKNNSWREEITVK